MHIYFTNAAKIIRALQEELSSQQANAPTNCWLHSHCLGLHTTAASSILNLSALIIFAASVKHIYIAFSSYRTNLYGIFMLQYRERAINCWQDYWSCWELSSSQRILFFAASVEYTCCVFSSYRNNLPGTVMLQHKESGSSCWNSHGKTLGHVQRDLHGK